MHDHEGLMLLIAGSLQLPLASVDGAQNLTRGAQQSLGLSVWHINI